MQITLYIRTYAVEGAPASVSFFPFSAHERHTFASGGVVYEAERKEVSVVVPDGAKIDADIKRLSWAAQKGPVMTWPGEKGPVKSTAQEVLDQARAGASGFRLAE